MLYLAVALTVVATTGAGEGGSATMPAADRSAEQPWDNGRPHADNMVVARSVVDDCLGPAAEVGEGVYDYTTMPIDDVRALAGASGFEVRVVGEDERCRPELAQDTGDEDRLNVYVLDGRVVWSRIF